MAEAQPETKDTKNNQATVNGRQESSPTTGSRDLTAGTAATDPATQPETPATETAPAAESTVSEGDTLRQEMENLRQQLETARDQVLRTQADMDNLRKRTTRDIENAHRYALDRFAAELLPVLDSLELGLSTSSGTGGIESFREGMALTLKKFQSTLEKFGVTVVDPQDQKFNPEKHEAVTMQAREGVAAGMVIGVMQKGYELNGRLVRPAMVIVAK